MMKRILLIISLLITVGMVVSQPLIQANPEGEKTLVVLMAGDIKNIDNDQSTGPAKNPLVNLYDWQFIKYGVKETTYHGEKVNVADTTKLVPGIVKSWETEILPDGRAKHILHLRKGAVHHSGNAVTANDLVWGQYRRARTGRDAVHKSVQTLYTLEDNGPVYAPDDYTFVYITRKDMPLDEHIWAMRPVWDHCCVLKNAPVEQFEDEYRKYLSRHPCAGGPFKLESWTSDVEMVMVKNENYWSEEYPKVDKIVWRVVPDPSTRAMMLREGDADIALKMPFDMLENLDAAPGVKVLYAPSTNTVKVGMNVGMEPFNDIRVRKALSYAFPYQTVIDNVYGGYAQRLNSFVPQGIEHSIPEPYYDTNVEKAKELLKEAGISEGYTFPLYYNSAKKQHEEAAVIFRDQIKKMGYKLELHPTPVAQFESQRREHGLPLFFQESLAWIQDAGYEISMSYVTWSHNNYTGWGSEEFDELAKEINFESNEEKRDNLIDEAFDIIMEDAPNIYIAQPDFALAMRDNIEGYVVQNTELHHLWRVDKVEE